jgi:predicted phosphodiesterase
MLRKLFSLSLFLAIFFAGCLPREMKYRTTDEIRQLEQRRSSETINRLLEARAQVPKIPGFLHFPIQTGWKIKPVTEKNMGSPHLLDDTNWELAEVGFKWYEINFAYWFQRKISIPEEIGGFQTPGLPILLVLSVNDDEQIWVDGKLKQDYDSFGGNVQLTNSAVPGEKFLITIRGLNGPGKGELRHVELRIGPVVELEQRLAELKSRIISQAGALLRLPVIESRWLTAIDESVAQLRQIPQLKNLAAIRAQFTKIENQLVLLENDHADYPAVVVEPYLQAVSQTEVTILWETDLAADSEVNWGETPDCVNTESIADTTRMHVVKLSGLKPETTYYYRIRSNKIHGSINTFRTAPKPETPFKFAVWGDSHHGVKITEKLERLALNAGAELLVQPGDAVNHGSDPQQWFEQFFEPIRHFAASHPVYLAPGNHEYGGYWDTHRPLLYEKYLKHPGNPYWFSFEYGNAFFIMLDPNKNSPPFDIPPESEQFQWLVRELNSAKFKAATWHFVILHQPPFAECWSGGYYDGEAGLREHLVPLLEQYPIDLVFSGHAHAYERGRWPKADGPFYVITGGAGGTIDDEHYRDWEQIELYHHSYHFCLIEINGTRLHFSAITPDDQIIDRFETTPRAPMPR